MSTYWRKLGLLYSLPVGGVHPLLQSHVANPLPMHLHGDVYRVFYSARDAMKRSSVGAVDIDIVTRQVVCAHTQPVFSFGPAGSFYAAGVSIGNCYEADGTTYMLFMGWQNPPGGHWRGDVGRLRVGPDMSLSLDATEPFMSSDATDPISLSYPWVERYAANQYRMWYGSTLTWDAGNGEMIHCFHGATSENGHVWHKTGLAIPYELNKAQAFSRPTLLRSDSGLHEMWFSYRSGTGESYRVGYAHSTDGVEWVLDVAKAGITVSAEGWDSEMIEYPFVFRHKGAEYMLYNGNGNGMTGFGLAVRVYGS
jgi:hypothetical protein